MEVRAGYGAVMLCRPFAGIDGFREAEIECELRNDLPAETDICSSTQAIDGRDRESIEHIVLIMIDAAHPLLYIKALQAELDNHGDGLHMVLDILMDTYAVRP